MTLLICSFDACVEVVGVGVVGVVIAVIDVVFAVGYSLMCLSALAIAVMCVSLWRRAAAAGAMCEV